MNYKLIFLSIGFLNIFRGIGYYVKAEHLTITKFENIFLVSDNVLKAGVELHKTLGISILALGLVLVFLSWLNKYYANKVLLGISIAFLISFLNGLLQSLDGDIIIPILALSFYFCCFLYSFFGYLSTR